MKIAHRGRLIVIGLGIFGVFLTILSSLLLGFFDPIVRIFVKKELVLQPGSEFFEIWKELPIPIYQNIYVFNLTNPKEFTQGEKPIVKELGPYVFKGRWAKEDMVWDDENGTVTYRDIKEYTFDPERSIGDQEEMIYTLNGPLLAVINYVEEYVPWFGALIGGQIFDGIFEGYNETLIVHRSVRELVYDGYHVPMAADLLKAVEGIVSVPLKLINETFGILHERKHIGDGVFTIRSGLHSIDDYAAIQQWNNQSEVDWWHGDKCNEIRGTDGVQYAPGVTRNTTLSLFNPNLCRVIPIQYERDVTVHGIKTLRFGIASNAMATGEVNPENQCYCQGTDCYNGIIPLNCKKGAPYVISLPHFLGADEVLIESVEGVNPIPEKHKTYVDVEATTGFVLNAAFRMQLNGVTKRYSHYAVMENVSDAIVPVLWMSEEAELDTFFANYFKSRVQTPLLMFKVFCMTMLPVGAFWIVAAIVMLLCIKGKVQPEDVKQSFVLKTLNSVYMSVSLWPPAEEDAKNVSEKTQL